MLSNDYDFSDRSYEVAVRDLKAIMFDIIMNDKNDLSNIQKVIAGIGEDTVAELKELYDKKNSALNDVIANTNQLVSDLKNLDLYSTKLVELEAKLGIANVLIGEDSTKTDTSVKMVVPIASEVELTNSIDTVASSTDDVVENAQLSETVDPVSNSVVDPEIISAEVNPSEETDSVQVSEGVTPAPVEAAKTQASELEDTANLSTEAKSSEETDGPQVSEGVIPAPVEAAKTQASELEDAANLSAEVKSSEETDSPQVLEGVTLAPVEVAKTQASELEDAANLSTETKSSEETDSPQISESVTPAPVEAAKTQASELEDAANLSIEAKSSEETDSPQISESVTPAPVEAAKTQASELEGVTNLSTEVGETDSAQVLESVLPAPVEEVDVVPDFGRDGVGEDKPIIVSNKQNTNLLSSRDVNKAKFETIKSNLVYTQKVVSDQIIPVISGNYSGEVTQSAVNSSMSETAVGDKREVMTQQATQLYSEGKIEEAKALLDEVAALNQQYQANESIVKVA